MASQLTISAPCYEFAYILEIPHANMLKKLDMLKSIQCVHNQPGCIFRLTCSHPELTKDHVLTSVYVNFFRTVTRNAVNKSV